MRVNNAIEDAIKKLQRLGIPPSVRIDRPVEPDDLRLRKNLMIAIAQAFDEAIAAVASESAEHSNRISRPDFISIASNALHDESLLDQFDIAIEELEQIAVEKQESHGSTRAREKISA